MTFRRWRQDWALYLFAALVVVGWILAAWWSVTAASRIET